MVKEKTKKMKRSFKEVWTEFKQFINRGNALNLAVGVVIGGAFSAIVTSVTNILLSVCTWAVPGGLNGLITVLPALSDSQKGLAGIGQTFASADLTSIAESYVTAQFPGEEITPTIIQNGISDITSKYTLYGNVYVYNQCATINWGSFINAVISFLIIALTLFIIIKVFKYVKQKRLEALQDAKAQGYITADKINARYRNLRLTNSEIKRLHILLNAGVPKKDIAKLLRISVDSIRRIEKDLAELGA